MENQFKFEVDPENGSFLGGLGITDARRSVLTELMGEAKKTAQNINHHMALVSGHAQTPQELAFMCMCLGGVQAREMYGMDKQDPLRMLAELLGGKKDSKQDALKDVMILCFESLGLALKNSDVKQDENVWRAIGLMKFPGGEAELQMHIVRDQNLWSDEPSNPAIRVYKHEHGMAIRTVPSTHPDEEKGGEWQDKGHSERFPADNQQKQ